MQKSDRSESRRFPFGILMGVGAGMALGVALKSLAIGIALGSGLAIVFGLALDRRRSSSNE